MPTILVEDDNAYTLMPTSNILIDARLLLHECFSIRNVSHWLHTRQVHSLEFLPGMYHFEVSGSTTGFGFSVTEEGTVDYSSDAAKFCLATGRIASP